MALERHGNRWRAVIYDKQGKRLARKSFTTKAEAGKWERTEYARRLLSDEQQERFDQKEWARHHRFIEKPDFFHRIEERQRGKSLLTVLEEQPTQTYQTQPPNTMLVYHDPDQRGIPGEKKPGSPVKLSDALERYRDIVVPTHEHPDRETIKIKMILRESRWLVSKRITDLTREDFNRYRDIRCEEVSGATAKGEIKLFHRVIEYARDEMKVTLQENPASKIKFYVETDVKRTRILKPDEEKKLLARAYPLLRDIIIVALDTSLRKGEIVQIEPSWFQSFGTPEAHLLVPPGVNKNGESKFVPVSVRIEEILTRRAQNPKGIFPIRAKSVTKEFIDLTRECRIVDLHFHDLRHTAVTRLHARGLSTAEVMRISGHRTIPMVLRYTHPDAGPLSAKLRAF